MTEEIEGILVEEAEVGDEACGSGLMQGFICADGAGGYSRGEYRVTVSGLSSRCSWQDLKDFLRRGGEVCYADVRNGEG